MQEEEEEGERAQELQVGGDLVPGPEVLQVKVHKALEVPAADPPVHGLHTCNDGHNRHLREHCYEGLDEQSDLKPLRQPEEDSQGAADNNDKAGVGAEAFCTG